MGQHRDILRIALPAIVTNVTVPLLGLVDTAIAGHLGRAECIGGIAVGGVMLGLVYQNFIFLRMGTSGITAQAFGAGRASEAAATLQRSIRLAALIGAALIALQFPLQWIALLAVGPSEEVGALARSYFYIVIWGAPAILVTMAVKGWLLGMQDSRAPMVLSVSVNLANIAASLVAVYGLGLGFRGIACGTIVAEYAGLALALWMASRKLASSGMSGIRGRAGRLAGRAGRFFAVNRDIFLRSVCLMAVTLTFTALGARCGDLELAANALMIQLFLLVSYFLDGFAFAGEAVVGRLAGAGLRAETRRCVGRLFQWGAGIMVVFAAVYALFSAEIFGLLTDDAAVVAVAWRYRWWCALLPVAGMAGFVWDGVFVGMTATRGMLMAVAVAVAVFFVICFLPVGGMSNHRLWAAFVSYLAMRGAVSTLYYRARLR